jgi:tetratricopeptide (TPR) repeat protein
MCWQRSFENVASTPPSGRPAQTHKTWSRLHLNGSCGNAGCYLSISHIILGELAEHPAAARERYEQSLDIVQRLAHTEWSSLQSMGCLSMSYRRLGNLAERSDPEEARKWYEQSLKIRKRLAEADPYNLHHAQGALSISYTNLGNLARRSDPARARNYFEQSLIIDRRLVEMEPDNVVAQDALSRTCVSLGDLVAPSDPEAALDWYRESLSIRQRLAGAEPDNFRAQRGLSFGFCRMGDLAMRNDPAAARDSYGRSLAINERLAEADPSNADFRQALAESLGRLAIALKAGGALAEAHRHHQQASHQFGEAERLSPGNQGSRYARACIDAMWGASEQALQSLQQATDLGYKDADWAANDPDFTSLRGMPEFEQLLSRMRRS